MIRRRFQLCYKDLICAILGQTLGRYDLLLNCQVLTSISANSDLYVTVQLWADSKPLTVPVQTAYRSFKSARTWNEWLELPITIATLPLTSQLAITVWDLSPTGGKGARGHAIPYGGTTVPLFDKDNTLQKGRQKCRLYRHKAADGFSFPTTHSTPRPPRKGINHATGSDGKIPE